MTPLFSATTLLLRSFCLLLGPVGVTMPASRYIPSLPLQYYYVVPRHPNLSHIEAPSLLVLAL